MLLVAFRKINLQGDVEMWMDRWFVRFFRHCKLERYPSRHVEESASDEEEVQKVLTMVHDTQIEITARRVACTWLEQAVLEKNQMIEKIAGRTGLPVGNSDGVIVVQEGQTVTAYFKAKRRDGSIGKSKTPREAVVVSLNEDTIRVKFVASKARHEIPMNWVVSSTPVPDPRLLSEGCSPERLARGKLAITLLRTEKAIAGFVLESFSQAADLLEELSRGVEGCRAQEDEEGYRKLLKIIQSFLDQEMVEVDEELQQVLPQSLADIPSDPGHKQFLDKPLYSVPEGYLDPKFTNDMMLLDGEDAVGVTAPAKPRKQNEQKANKDPVKRAAILAAKAKAKDEAEGKTEEVDAGDKDPKRRKVSTENGEKEPAKVAEATTEPAKEAKQDPSEVKAEAAKEEAKEEVKDEAKDDAKEDLEKFTVVQLKEKLRAAGLTVSGNKADLIKRLEVCTQEQAQATKAANESEASKPTEEKQEQEGVKNESDEAAKAEAGKEAKEAKDMEVDQEGEKKEEKQEAPQAEDKKDEAESKEKETKEEDNVDYLKELDEEIEQADNDVFEIEDVTDIGTGEPLFFSFGFEDWALLSLRFELHLLAHAFLHDCGDPERSGIYPDHLLFYYNRYYKKGLNPKNYGVEGIEDLVALVRDSIVICRPKVIESMLSPELEDNDIFIKLTEEARRERLRRLDAGDESARLKFATGGQSSAKATPKAPVIIPGKGAGKTEAIPQQTLLQQQQQRQQQIRQQMQMATGMQPAGSAPMGMPRAWGPPPAAFGVPLAQQRAMMARQPWG
ncbi:unnamed protein product [Symbiodinium natans]|uniref:SAP domain-containing protein n=1 Tax=Symbiodinium natans TaxID=878477 RepID=A0A812ST53_9DINO|nr:unnamed protein product [Symbiodinium natans]